MPRRKDPRIPDAVLDQLLAGADPFNAALSSIASANSRFSLAFSVSKARSRFASLTSRPVLALPLVKRRITHAVLAAQLGNWCPRPPAPSGCR